MEPSTIAIEVDSETARAFSEATPDDRKKMQLLLRLRLRDLPTRDPRSLLEIADEIGREAERSGLTPEILESLLNDG